MYREDLMVNDVSILGGNVRKEGSLQNGVLGRMLKDSTTVKDITVYSDIKISNFCHKY